MFILNDMEEEEKKETQSSGTFTYYLLGAVVIALIAGGVYFLRPKTTTPASPQPTEVVEVVATPTPGPITGLACDKQYYNPVVGLKKYYLSVDGVDLLTTKKVDCNFSVSVAGKVVASASAESGLTAVTERAGGAFRCDTTGVELEANVPTVVDVILTNDNKETATCTQTFLFPQQ